MRAGRVRDQVEDQDGALRIVVAPARQCRAEPCCPAVSGDPVIQGGLDRQRTSGADLTAGRLFQEKAVSRAAEHAEVAVAAWHLLEPESVVDQGGEVEETEA